MHPFEEDVISLPGLHWRRVGARGCGCDRTAPLSDLSPWEYGEFALCDYGEWEFGGDGGV